MFIPDEKTHKMTEVDSKTEVVESSTDNGDGPAAVVVAATAPTKLESDIIHQIEYYFGDANLVRDRFLQEQITKDSGWVELSVLLTFKRLASLSTDVAMIVDAISKSDEGLVEIHEDRTKIRRHPERPLPEQNEDTRKEQFERTVYVKGFPLEGSVMEDILAFFKPYEKVVNVIMRKYHDKPSKTYKFKGSVFATFATKEQAAEFMEKEKLEFEGKELVKKWSNDYTKEKKEEHANKANKNNKNKKVDENEKVFTLPVGTLLKLESISKDTTRETIKSAIIELGGDVSYVEFSTGDEMAVVRLKAENAAKELFAKFTNGKIKLDETQVTVTLVEGDEEKQFLAKASESMKNRRQNQRQKGGRGNRGFGKYQNNRKRAGSPQVGEGPPAKVK